MKITFNSFDCKIGLDTERVVLIHCENYPEFVSIFNLGLSGFDPEFISSKLNVFLFLENDLNWDAFVLNAILNSNIEIETKFRENYSVNFNDFHICNQHILDFLWDPTRKDVFKPSFAK